MRNRDHLLGQWNRFCYLLMLMLLQMGFINIAQAQQGQITPPVLQLEGANSIRGDSIRGLAWIDPTGKASLVEITDKTDPKHFIPWHAGKVDSVPNPGAMWLWLRIQRNQTSSARWTLELPVTYIDRVNFYSQSTSNSWQMQSAGDLLAVSDWSEPGRYPHIYLDIPTNKPTDIYIQLQHAYPMHLQIQMQAYSLYERGQQLEFLVMGLIAGGLLLLITYSLLQSYLKKEWVYFWFATYALLILLALASFAGFAGEYLWPDVPKQPGVYTRVFTTLVMGSVILLVRELFTPPVGSDSRRFYALVFALFYLPLAIIHLWIPSDVSAWVHAIFIIVGFVVLFWFSVRAILRDDKMGYWIVVSFSPLILSSIFFTVFRLLGYFPALWATQSVVYVLVSLQMPLLILAIEKRTYALYLNEFRSRSMSNHDALTNFFNPSNFQESLTSVINGQRANNKSVAVVVLSLVNYDDIKNQLGQGVAAHALLRCSNKMRRIFGTQVVMGRMQEARLGIIVTDVKSRAAILEYLVQLIAWGLKPLSGFDNEITIRFHLAVAFTHEHSMQSAMLTDTLNELLSNMSERTSRPIRFLEPNSQQMHSKVSESVLSTLD